MKDVTFKFYSSIIYLVSNIICFYLIHPTEGRYHRLRAVIKRAKAKNEAIPNNKYRYSILDMLINAEDTLFNVRLSVQDAKSEHVDDSDRLADRKVTFTFGTMCLSLKTRV